MKIPVVNIYLFDYYDIVGVFKDNSAEYIKFSGKAPTGKKCQMLCKAISASKNIRNNIVIQY